ncbi:MAG TPA: TRAM domain-containing protein [Vicinamibacterales bacterium]|nr:TRAM domain-containing protein [Vicinamibacterales bacterium]
MTNARSRANTSVLSPGETRSLLIEKPAAGGWMIARVDGQIVLVSGAIPGERVTARIGRVSRGVAYAKTTAVDAPSPDRRDAAADPECGGALYSHIAYDRQLAIKREVIADAFSRIARVTLPAAVSVAASREDGYRMRARLHVRGRRIGFFREATHDLCEVRQTRQLLPASCDLLERWSAALQSLAVDAVRELELSENVDATERAIALDLDRPVDAGVLERLASDEGLTGLVARGTVRGRPYVTDRFEVDGASLELRRDVRAFFQGNRYLLRPLITHVVGQLNDGPAVDLYAGVGLFAVAAAAARRLSVTAVEGDRYAAADLDANGSRAPGVRAVHQSVEAFVRGAPPRPDSVIVDPPRTGMSREALDGVLALGAPRIVYVSCDVATLARDARRFVDAGYAIARVDAFDLFPNTPHVETIVVLDRQA